MNDTRDREVGDSTPEEPTPGSGRRRRIGILLFDGVEELDAVGPWEVLSAWTQLHPEDGWDTFCLSADGGPVRGAKTLVLGPHHSTENVPTMDILIHPGGPGTRPMLHDGDHLDWVRQQRATVPLMASVCTGSLVYAAAGQPRTGPRSICFPSWTPRSSLTSGPGSSTTAT